MNSKVVITTDSPADLSAELETRYDIHVLPLYVNLGGKSYRDGIDITTPDIFRHYDETGELPTTSAIPIGDYETFFKSRTRDSPRREWTEFMSSTRAI